MLKWFLKALLQSLLILITLVLVSFILPVASFWLVRDPVGAQVVFWASPWVVAFWSVVAYVFVGSRFWRGKGSVKEWKLRHGSFLRRHAKTAAWMFASLAFSYGFEFAYIFAIPPSPLTRSIFPISTYLPLGFTILWSAIRG
jgi:hypothetical protein